MGEAVKAAAKAPVANKENKAPRVQKTELSHSMDSPVEQVLFLQRTIGNRAVERLIKSGGLQAKLRIGRPGDIYEQEADRVAEQVMRVTEQQVSEETKVSNSARNKPIQSKCQGCNKGTKIGKEEEEEKLQKKEASGSTPEVTPELESSISAIRGGGQPLPESARSFYEPRFGMDFSGVRVHTDSHSAETAKSINARAFTVGHNIAFGAGQFAPESHEGRKLMAHELTHVVQQTSTTSVWRRRLSAVDGEQEEELMEKGGTTPTQKLMLAPATGVPSVTPLLEGYQGITLQRVPDDETLEETAEKITERSAEKAWSKTSPGITEQEKPGEKFLMMNFAIREAGLKKEHKEFLRDTLYFGTLTSDPMAKIVIIGHADSTGSKSFNDRLSRKRAQEVEKAFRQMGRHNLRIDTVTGKGANEPIAQNDNVFGRAKNRRVEILVMPWKSEKPVPELLTELQKGMKPFVVKVDNFAACPFQDTVKNIVEDAFKSIPTIRFDWEGKSASPEAFISFDDTSTFSSALGLTGDIFLNSFRNNKICKTPGDDTTCEKVFPETADVMGRAIANTVAHETGHAFALDHVPATDNYMWSPELHPLKAKTNKTFDEKVVLQRTLQSVPETFNASQLVHIVNRIKENRKNKPGVVEFE